MRFKVPLQVKQLRGVKKALKLCFFYVYLFFYSSSSIMFLVPGKK